MYNLRNRSFLRLLDFTKKDIRYLLDLSRDLKRSKYTGTEVQRMRGKNIALIFEKDSTRTRCAFEVGAYDQGAHVTYLGPSGSHIGEKETVADTARVLGRMYDGIQYRGFSQKAVEDLAKYSGVPVWNGLTDVAHPTQILADFLTIEEHLGRLKGVKMAYCGDGRSNMANSLMEGAAIMGLDFRIVAPRALFPEAPLMAECEKLAQKSGGSILVTDSVDQGVKGAEVVYTDVWVSMGEPESVWDERIEMLKPYQVNAALMKKAAEKAIFMHCLPAFHNLDLAIGKKIYEKYGLNGVEVTEDVFESEASVVFDEAENRLHTIKAVMVATLGD
ncbi:MAG: ornithine carbamoyltransferase [Spirochaetia bacterium]